MFYTQSVFSSPRFIPSPYFIPSPQSVVRSPCFILTVSETTFSGSNANETAPSGFQQSTTPSGSSGTSTLGFENVHIQSPRSSTFGGIQSFVAPSTSHAGVAQSSDSVAPGNVSQSFTNFSTNANLMSSQPKAKLPKLGLPKFRGEVTQWQTAGWGQFQQCYPCKPAFKFNRQVQSFTFFIGGSGGESHIRSNEDRSKGQFSYRDIPKSFGKPQNIISKHMDEMLGVPGCVNDNASQLRLVYDKISVNIRGLESLVVSSNQYGSLLIPVIMSKLPHEIRVQVARNTAREVWDMPELLEVIQQEVEAREISEGVKTNVNLEKVNPKPQRTCTYSECSPLTRWHANISVKRNSSEMCVL